MRRRLFWLIMLAPFILGAYGYYTLRSADEAVKAAGAEVLKQYQRRADLAPNLVNIARVHAAREKEVLARVTEARAKVGAIPAKPEVLNDEQVLARFLAAQGEMRSTLARLLLLAERYPPLKADATFREFRAQLEGTENRGVSARLRYAKAVHEYNATVSRFPGNFAAMLFGFKAKPSLGIETEQAPAKPLAAKFGAPARSE